MILLLLLRVAGASLLVLAAFHLVLARALKWRTEIARLSPINARVFLVHTFFIAFLLAALGLLSLLRPQLLLLPSELTTLLLWTIVLFWMLRLAAQPAYFDPVLTEGWPAHPWIRRSATVLWASYALIYGDALMAQIEPNGFLAWIAPFDLRVRATWIRLGIALVWLVFGFLFKAMDALPRHRQIVARVVGEAMARGITMLVALGEIGLGLWMLSGRYLPICMTVQTVALIAMNTLEIRHARDLLVSPIGMVVANLVLLSIGWYVALTLPF